MGPREGWIAAALLALLTAALTIPEIRGHDGVGNYAYLPSILNDGDLNFGNEYRNYDISRNTPYRMSDEAVSPRTGYPANRYGVGAALFWAPMVGATHYFLELTAPDLATGYSKPYEWAVALGSAFWGCLGLGLLLERLRRDLRPSTAWAALGATAFATNLVFYIWMHGSMSHAVSFFAAVMAALAFERAIRPGERPWLWLAAGFWAGALTLIRFQDLSWTATLGVCFVIFFGRGATGDSEAVTPPGWKKRIAAASVFAVGILLAMAPQMAVWNILYGSWFSGPTPYFNQGHGYFERFPKHILQVLLSERGGVFAWHPILLIGLIGLIAAARKPNWLGRPMAVTGLVGFAAQLYLVSSWSMWWGGASFGNRFFISSFAFLALGVGLIFDQLSGGENRRRVWILTALLIAWNFGLLIQYGTEMISREDEVGWGLVLKNQFTRAPEWLLDRL